MMDDARREWLERLSAALAELAHGLRRDQPSHHRALIESMDALRARLERELHGQPPSAEGAEQAPG
jgi:hypothetical protein